MQPRAIFLHQHRRHNVFERLIELLELFDAVLNALREAEEGEQRGHMLSVAGAGQRAAAALGILGAKRESGVLCARPLRTIEVHCLTLVCE